MENRFGERLRQIRLENKITQREFAEQVGLTPSSISAYEKGNRVPDLDIAQKIAEKTGVSLDWLCGIGKSKNKDDSYQGLIWKDEKGNKKIWFNDVLKMIAFLCDIGICTGDVNYSDGLHFLDLEFFENEIISFYKNLETLVSLKRNGVLSEELYNAAVNGLYNSSNRYTYTVEKAVTPEDLDGFVEIDDDSKTLF